MQNWYTGFLYVDYFRETIPLPHIPPDFPINEPEFDNETYDGLSRQYTRIGKPKLRTWEWKSFFPLVGEKHFSLLTYGDGWETVEKIRQWRNRRIPVRFILSDRNYVNRLNVAATIDKFDATLSKVGRIEYDIKLTEYNFVK